VSLLARAAGHLTAQGSAFAVIGAAALAVHGVARSTQDLDLLVADRRCLDLDYWAAIRAAGMEVAVHPGDDADPLAGVARLRADGQPDLDVVVGKPAWHAGVITRAEGARILGVGVPVARPADLILLKLYAGGPQDAWDIAQLLAAGDASALAAEVQARLPELPPEADRLWARIREGETRR
jgi:hypothetical protein